MTGGFPGWSTVVVAASCPQNAVRLWLRLEAPQFEVELIPVSLRHDITCEAAYYHAERRGFVPGRELEDWLAAEQQIDEFTTGRYRY